MTFAHLNRRMHLYLGLALLPWFLMYGLSSIPFAHTPFFDGATQPRACRCGRSGPPTGRSAGSGRTRGAARARRRAAAARRTSSTSSFGVYRQSPTQVNVYAYSFRHSTQLKYFTDQKRMTVEDRRFRWDHFLTGMHGRGGFEQEGLLDRSWSVDRGSRLRSDPAVDCDGALHVVGTARLTGLGLGHYRAPAPRAFVFFTLRL